MNRETNRFLSKFCTVSDGSFPYCTYKSVSSFGLTKQLPVSPFLISGLLLKIGDAGHRSPYLSHAKRALYHLSYVPVEETGSYTLSNLSSVFETVEQSPLLHIVVILALSVRVINPRVSHMPIACPPDWHASLVGSTWAVYVRRMSLIVLSVEFMFPSTSFWGKPWRFGALIAFSASSVLFQMLPFPYWTYKSMSSFGVTKQLSVFPFLISGLLWKIGDPGHYSPYLSHAKRALYHLSYIPVEETGSFCLIKPYLCYWNSWTGSSIAYRCNNGFVDAGHQSMCFSHANRLPFRLTCLAGGVHMSCLCQTDVFDCVISRVYVSSDVFLR